MVKIDGVIFKRMIISGANNLYNTYPEIDNLNVFPVPGPAIVSRGPSVVRIAIFCSSLALPKSNTNLTYCNS